MGAFKNGPMVTRRTPLYDLHRDLGARMVPFAGYEMPVQYTSIIEEHHAVRNHAGLFDVSHMGEIVVSGADSARFLDSVTCNEVAALEPGRVQYNAVTNNGGGLVDDITIYCLSATEFFVVANASNHEAVTKHFLENKASYEVDITNRSEDWHQLALQGPKSVEVLKQATGLDCKHLQYFSFEDVEHEGERLRISRTGYTGEDGFEIYSEIETGVKLWRRLLANGTVGIKPCGLGARDTLRLEARYPLYGHELNETWTPVESGIGFIVREKKAGFLGSERILAHKRSGAPGRVVGFTLETAGVPRDGFPVLDANGKALGQVLSGTHSPTLKKGIGTTYVPIGESAAGTSLKIEVRGRALPARVLSGPFVRGSAGKAT